MGTRASSEHTYSEVLCISLALSVYLLGIILLLDLSPNNIYYSCHNQPKGISRI